MAEINVSEVTSGNIEGSGAFDEIMKAAQIRLNHEYEKDRIKGTEYSKVYLGSMEQAMQQSIAFVLGRQQASAQADLTILQGSLIEIEKENAKKQGELIDQQILKMQAEVHVLEKELIIMDSKILVAEQEVKKSMQEAINLEAQLPQIQAQTSNINADTKLKAQQEINMQKQNDKTDQEILVLQQEVLSAIEQVKLVIAQVAKMEQDVELATYQTFSEAAKTLDELPNASGGAAYPLAGLLLKQKNKMQEEIELLQAKKHTEQASTKDQVDGVTVAGTIGKQKDVYTVQAAGFTRKAEQDMAKIMTDSYNVRRSTNESETEPPSMTDKNINAVIEKAGAGIGVAIDSTAEVAAAPPE